MLTRDEILALIPHQGKSCLLDQMLHCDADKIVCVARSHLDPDQPLRFQDRLHPLCGAEYGMQAAALHGALQHEHGRGGYLAALREVELAVERLDDPNHGALQVTAELESADSAALLYRFRLVSEGGSLLVQGRGMVIRAACAA